MFINLTPLKSIFFLSSLPAPYLMAYNTTDQVYYLKQYSEIKDEFTEEQLVSFLEDVFEGRAKVWCTCILEGVNDHDSDDREARGLLPIIVYRLQVYRERVGKFGSLNLYLIFLNIFVGIWRRFLFPEVVQSKLPQTWKVALSFFSCQSVVLIF